MAGKFSAHMVSDQKRLARGEQWLLARSLLRAMHRTHRSDWRVMTLAGESPKGELTAIRELMPNAHIVAVDKSAICVQAAIEAGATESICADLEEYQLIDGSPVKYPALGLAGRKFDVVNLDLCAGATESTKNIFHTYRKLVNRPGVMMVTFCYGRDVVEFFKFRVNAEPYLAESGVPDVVCRRISYLLGKLTKSIKSVVLYQGNEMPMCSVVLSCHGAGHRDQHLEKCSFVKLQEGDFDLAVTHPDVSRLYDCPEDRLNAIRRSFIAIRAVQTRRERQRK